MYSRVTSLEIDPVRMSVEGALARYKDEVLPRLREEQGYEGILMLATPEGQGLVITLWATAADAERGVEGGLYSDTIERFVTIFRAPPGREHYEVMFAEAASLAAG
jgi:hypothetical protein